MKLNNIILGLLASSISVGAHAAEKWNCQTTGSITRSLYNHSGPTKLIARLGVMSDCKYDKTGGRGQQCLDTVCKPIQ